LASTAEELTIDRIGIDRPQLAAACDADGVLHAAGLRFAPRAGASAAAPADTSAPEAPPSRLSIGEFKVENGALLWRDDARTTPVTCRADFALQAQRLTVGPRAAPTPVQLTLGLSDTVERLAVTGEVQLDPDRFACGLGIEGRGLRGGALAAYLPPGLQLTLDDGELLGRLEAGIGPAEGGGRTLRLRVQDLSLRNGSASLLELPELAVVVPRFDPAARAYHVSKCRLDGLRATVTTFADGLEVAGLRLSPPARPEAAATGPGAPPVRVAVPTVRSLPELRLEGLDVQAAGIRIVDGTRADAEPLDVSLRLTTTPWHGTVDDGTPEAPLEVRLTAAAAPLLRTATLDLTLHPLLAEPRIEGKLEAVGIDTTALLRVRPGLADRLAGDVQEGTLGLRFLAEFDLHRSRRDEFPFGMPFAVHTEVHDLALRGTPDGPLLAGLENFSCDVPMFDPRTGDVRAQTIDVQTPALHLVRQQDGLHALGFVLRGDAAPAEAPVPEEPVPPEPRTRPLFAAAEILVSGLDFRYTNTISSPPTELPLDDLELVISRFSTAGLREPLPFRFELSLGGADIELPVPQRNSSFLTGIFNTAASAVGVGGDKQVMAQQPWFDALHVDGQLQLFPAPQGHVRASLGSFDLRCLSRLAEGAGADIHDGIFDAGVTVELRGEQGTSVESQLVFTHLSMSEPAGGPVSTYLKLPVSLDTMLYVLRNDQDEQRVPLSFEIHKGEVNGEVIAAKAVTALGAVLADAIAKSPLRVAGVFTGLLGLGGGSEDLAKRAASLTFVPGDASLPADLQAQLQSLVAFAAGDKGITLVLKHDLGGADLERLQVLANPPAADAAALAARLRQELAVSNKERTALAATVEAQIAAGHTYQSRESRARLQAIDRASGTKAAALDAALQLLRPDRERRDDARTRAAAQQLATARLRALELWLAGKLGPGGELRVEVRTPRFTAAAPPAGPGGGTIAIVPVRRQRS
ncbi:MAG TPA: DUF748 domain-containing protein, partial [Planctomycetota bacterium]|nr:DUF748 domain-containing protein [Planctomycetota bacterium]